jgi:hypothetical protein
VKGVQEEEKLVSINFSCVLEAKNVNNSFEIGLIGTFGKG